MNRRTTCRDRRRRNGRPRRGAALAARGFAVTSLEAAARPGGKMREVEVGGRRDRRRADRPDDALGVRRDFRRCGGVFVRSGRPSPRRQARTPRLGGRLPCSTSFQRSSAAQTRSPGFAGAREAEGYRRFCARAQAIYETLRDSFIRASRPGPLALTARVGAAHLPDLMRISPFTAMWRRFGGVFRRSASAPAFRPIRDLLRLVSVPRPRDADACRPCRAGGRLARRWRNGAAGRGVVRSGASLAARCFGSAAE